MKKVWIGAIVVIVVVVLVLVLKKGGSDGPPDKGSQIPTPAGEVIPQEGLDAIEAGKAQQEAQQAAAKAAAGMD